MVQATFLGTIEHNNSKTLLFQLKFTGNYGANGVGDLLNLAPYSPANPTGVLDPTCSYNNPIAQVPLAVGVFTDKLGGSWTNPAPNANPTLANLGIIMYEPGGVEKATNAAYTAAELAGFTTLQVVQALQ